MKLDILNTIQKQNKLNFVFRKGDVGPGGAYHEYGIMIANSHCEIANLQFQKGPRNELVRTDGILDCDLLEIVRDRLKCFKAGPFSTRENALALTHVEEALMWLNMRVEDRAERNVLGTYEK